MFYYIASKKPRLEVNIVENYSEEDLERIFLYIEALLDNPKMNVTFKVLPSIKEQFKQTLSSRRWNPFYAYNIQENVT
ncbi:hypothetical protein [Cochleicola gelatinilyticus]|uniref:Uncharacterized protein n=1 Tax=Cochleicola gelatinilyticus TaxID=1763537 RepID=A0A167F161_9FLAO|nr:hypothetical protein [Cochleicola gelatinilyticus]OAB76083.1 hypothetical protein ULVI_13575 [Cochleicola gelatinilyticus]